ncbi:hypothetical protein MKX70_22110 [Paenibacillus sp. FSL R7-0312]|uniref:hypothetical protein n=1 Tax=unclassified Paenibacillus TaxID=185978 RepID=UPI0004F87403|nr:hypothetical protein [Paenibacillus sp. FSL R5-0912]AIQ41611.1 hypothetical protein R50912_17365 [Paenibacillus sp. FSL R5-0912]
MEMRQHQLHQFPIHYYPRLQIRKLLFYGVQEKAQKDIFSSLDVVINGETKTFNWINVTNPSFYPQISVIDLDADGEDEIVIVLTKGAQ